MLGTTDVAALWDECPGLKVKMLQFLRIERSSGEQICLNNLKRTALDHLATDTLHLHPWTC